MFTPCPNFASAAVACGTVNAGECGQISAIAYEQYHFSRKLTCELKMVVLVLYFLHQDGLHGAILTGVPGKAAAETGLGVAVAAIRALDVLRSALDRLFDL